MKMLSTRNRSAALALVALFFCCSPSLSNAQENIQLQIPASLVECYNTSYFMNRDNRLPATVETLIALIEKVENFDGYNGDIRTLAVSLLHRFRQDGIQRAPGIAAIPGVIPYSPTGFQFPKFRILLSRLIPGNALTFPNSSLTREERCSLHFMLSNNFDMHVRGDENQVCNRLSQYRANRLPRDLNAAPRSNNFIADVEMLESVNNARANKRGAPRMQMHPNPSAQSFDTEFGWNDPGYNNNNNNNDNSISQCPTEGGVMWTPWGTVAAGTLIAGIAAGLQQQSVQLRTLLSLSRRGGSNLPQTATVNVDNRWAATLAGDLAEVALLQMPVSTTGNAIVGANGGWNSTVMPKWYFLSQRKNLEMTDAEIRGGLDGLIIAMNIANWRTQASSLKLSQLLRMYYSMNGVLGSGIMACNRKDNFQTYAPLSDMIPQTAAFAQVLDRDMQLHVTLTPTAISQFSTAAANALQPYVPQYLNDVSCAVSNSQPQDVSQRITAMTDIYVFLDTSWQYLSVVDYVNYILQRLNINPYGSSVTLVGAADGGIIVNRTHYMDNVYLQWNVSTHQMRTPGFNLPTILRTVQNLTQGLMSEEQRNNSIAGRSLVALLIPYMSTVNEGDSNYATTQLQYISEQIPDLKFIYYAGGSINRFNSFVTDPAQDLYQLNVGSNNVASSSGPVVMRIKKIPRRIINPRCGSNWYLTSYGTDQKNQYVAPGYVNFYRVAPNYFFGAGSNRYLRIQPQSALQFTVCSSRSTVLPLQNSTTSSSSDMNCVQVSGNQYQLDLSTQCNGYATIHQCPPLYVSVQGVKSTTGSIQTVSCVDKACQTPDQAKYVMSVENLGCYSGVSGLFASFLTLSLAYFLRHFLQ